MTIPGPAFPKPTAQIEPFHKVLGPELTIIFLLQFGGAPLTLSKNPEGRSALEHLVGEANAREIGRTCGHLTKKRVPLAKRWLAQALKVQGHSNAQIARTLRATDVSVSGWLNGKTGRR
ncbi:MAG: helix-turn-helix domain-containing protein, partial [Tabrizicola sp.]|nr:helix-turn-helix domain-containing protein [Tabrizicola sp.]